MGMVLTLSWRIVLALQIIFHGMRLDIVVDEKVSYGRNIIYFWNRQTFTI